MRKRFLAIALGFGLLSGTSVFFRGEVIRASTDSGTELLSVQIFWVDPGDPPAPDNVPGRYDLYRYRILAEEEPGGWREGAGRALEGTVYWEAVFKLTHIRREEVVWVDAMGPALIKPPRKWLDIFRRPGSAPESAQGAANGSCLGLGLLNLCINMPKMVRSLNKRLYPLERSRVRVTHSLWDAGESCGVVVVGRKGKLSRRSQVPATVQPE